MPYDGSGNFTIINNFEEDRINGVSIDSLKMDNNFNDIANGLSNVMLRSGSVVMTGILNMGDHKITNLVAGTSSKDAVNKSQMDTALSAKQATITGGASTITSSNLTANRALVSSSSGKVAVSAATSTELGYLSGVTSAIQTQLNGTVKTSGDQTIAGEKTFNNVTKLKSSLQLQSTEIEKGTNPSSSKYQILAFYDKNGTAQQNKIGQIYTTYAQGVLSVSMEVFQPVSDSTNTAGIRVFYPASGNPYTSAPTPTNTTQTSGTQIATTGWVNSVGNSVVHLYGDETINGEKTFTGTIVKASTNSLHALTIQDTTVTKGTAPSTGVQTRIILSDKNGISGYTNTLASVQFNYDTSKTTSVELKAFKPVLGDTTSSTLGVYYPASGDPYASAPASDVNGSILTTVNKARSSNGYFQLGNGMIVQWGRVTGITSNTETTVTFPKAFSSSTSYTIVKNYQSNATTEAGDREVSFYSMTATSAKTFTARDDTSAFSWLAIGY